MRVSFLFFLTALLVFSYGTLASAQTGFTANLSLGSRGAQVVALQERLNQDPDTRVASAGPGSPGNETDYFGSLTKTAVARFQSKYADEVLAPAGLTQGNGFVGFYTRIKLSSLASSATNTGDAILGAAPSSPASVSATDSQNPNLKNIDRLLLAIDKVGIKQGLSTTDLAAIKKQVMKDAATTTNLRAEFLKQVGYHSHQAVQDGSWTGKILATITQVLNSVFMPGRALASDWSEGSNGSDPSVPFGGALLETFYCSQSKTWLITLEPLPPSYAALLTYVPFSQAFLSYNIPVTNWLLGEYAPGAGVCVAGACPYCVTIPSEGMISPKVGSAPL